MQTKQQKQQKAANKLATELLNEIANHDRIQSQVTYYVHKSHRHMMIESQLRNLKLKGITPDADIPTLS